jgi:16S rRNA (adenine1518-N6/adenine1519-N6)-dimethyltransferase
MKAKRSLGQNFLVGSHYPRRIVDSVSPQPGETIIEIGPGRGALTDLLVESKAQIYSIELDRELIPSLTERFNQYANFRLIEGDALEVDFCRLITPASSARVVANLPYNAATPILRHLIGQRRCLREMTLMLQREVVDRLTAEPGGKEYGYLSVLVQFYCETEKLFDVPPGAFRPAPKVYSSVVRLRLRQQPLSVVKNEWLFLELIKVLFAHRRKTILNNLRSGCSKLGVSDELLMVRALNDSSIDTRRRAETLSIEEIARLSNVLAGENVRKKR